MVSVAQDGKLLRGVDKDTLYDILMTYLAGRLYLRVKRGVHVDHFDGVPMMKKYDEDEPAEADVADASVTEEPDDDFPVQMSVFEVEKAPIAGEEKTESEKDTEI